MNDADLQAPDAAVAAELDPLNDAVRSFRELVDVSKIEFREEVVSLNRCAKVVKGGRRFSFAALVVIGDGKGHVGVGFGKANEVPDAIQKGIESAKKHVIRIPLVGRSIPFEIIGEFGAARVMLRPAAEGTGIIAGPAARAVLSLAGVQDILTKSLGSSRQLNVVRATFEGLRNLEIAESVALRRGKTLEQLLGRKTADRYRKGRSDAMTGHAVVRAEESRRTEKSRLGTYTAGGRGDDDAEQPARS